jgi:hypothetical protein
LTRSEPLPAKPACSRIETTGGSGGVRRQPGIAATTIRSAMTSLARLGRSIWADGALRLALRSDSARLHGGPVAPRLLGVAHYNPTRVSGTAVAPPGASPPGAPGVPIGSTAPVGGPLGTAEKIGIHELSGAYVGMPPARFASALKVRWLRQAARTYA